MKPRNTAVSLLQATRESPILARLSDLVHESDLRLQAISPLIPNHLLKGIHAGPVDGGSWCLLLDSNAIAAKVRQLVPTFVEHLNAKGFSVETIRLKVNSAQASTR